MPSRPVSIGYCSIVAVVVGVLLDPAWRQIDCGGLADQLERLFDRIAPQMHRQLVHERAGGVGVEDVLHRAQPADAHVRLRLPELRQMLGMAKGRSARPSALSHCPGFTASAVNRDYDRGKHRALAPGRRPPLRVEGGLEILGGGRVIVAVVDVVLAGPGHLDRGADDLEMIAASAAKSGFDLRPKAPPSSVTREVTLAGSMPSAAANVLRRNWGSWVEDQTAAESVWTWATADGGSIGACTKCGV